MATVTPQQLHEALAEYFSLSELRDLCFKLNIEYENLSGEGKDDKARALVEHAQRHGLFDTVVAYVQKVRPNAHLGSAASAGSGSAAPATPQQPAAQSGPVYHIYGDVTASTLGGGSVEAENIAGRDVNITYNEPQNREEFASQLAELEALLKEAKANAVPGAETAVEDVQQAIEEAKKPEPSPRRLTDRLEYVQEFLDKAGGVAGAAKKAGTAVLKAAPIISGLIKAAALLF